MTSENAAKREALDRVVLEIDALTNIFCQDGTFDEHREAKNFDKNFFVLEDLLIRQIGFRPVNAKKRSMFHELTWRVSSGLKLPILAVTRSPPMVFDYE